MAISELNKISQEAVGLFEVGGVYIAHRTGHVPVSQPSINIVTVSAHRKEAINATEWLINTLKERVPIWKKEFYAETTLIENQNP